jgi:hypothetical protein
MKFAAVKILERLTKTIPGMYSIMNVFPEAFPKPTEFWKKLAIAIMKCFVNFRMPASIFLIAG